MSISRFLTAIVTVAMGGVLGCVSFTVLIFAEKDRGAMNEVFSAGLGVGYLLPAICMALLVTVLATALIARYNVSLARLFGLSAVAVFGILLVLAALLAAYVSFAALGVAVAFTGAILVVLAVNAMQRRAV